MEEGHRVADYFIIAGLPSDPADQTVLDENSLEVNLKPSHNQVRWYCMPKKSCPFYTVSIDIYLLYFIKKTGLDFLDYYTVLEFFLM